ncbi:MAG: hypothetical protein ABIR54_11850 [Burkholderiaceae bacterium]
MSHETSAGFAPSGRMLVAVLLAASAWVAWGLARHPGFQPVSWLRIAAPILALLCGSGFARQVSQWRSRIDGEREFDRGGKALLLGFVMVGATFVAWLLVSQAIPATLTALAGTARSEAGVVTRRVPATTEVDCRFRLEVAGAPTASGAVPHPMDECVDEALWKKATEGGPVSLDLIGGVLGAELVGVEPAAGSR